MLILWSPIEVPELASWNMDHPLALGPLFLDSPDVSQIKFYRHIRCSCPLSQLLLLINYLWCDLVHPPMDLDRTSKVAICVTLFTNEKVWGLLRKLERQNSEVVQGRISFTASASSIEIPLFGLLGKPGHRHLDSERLCIVSTDKTKFSMGR